MKVTRYVRALASLEKRGDAREESYYPALATLIKDVAKAGGRPDIQVTIQPRPTEGGNPDFRVWDGHALVIGYVEAKAPGKALGRVEKTAQLKRYRGTFPNLILTDFHQFRLYREGSLVAKADLDSDQDGVVALLNRFLDFAVPKADTPETLAMELAKRTRFLRDVVLAELKREKGHGPLSGFLEAFQKFLLSNLKAQDFADLYAQTLTYGLLAARTRTVGGFTRASAFNHIPKNLGVLRDMFRFISLGDLPDNLAWAVDDIACVLDHADVPGMVSRHREGDFVVHFYETFLAQYDPEEREKRGVYYTPDAVVQYIVKSIHTLLKQEFGRTGGLADSGVTLLDPAAGTMAFIASASRLAMQEFSAAYGDGGKETFIQEHLLKDFHAFELMVAPYAVGHLKMALTLEELGYQLGPNDRIPFYLTNTLDMSDPESSTLPGFAALAEEARLADQVKRDQPILVILGNPPYSGESTNNGEWILDQLQAYKQVDGQPLGERNTKWLQDDYVKFLRLAQWKIHQAGHGIVGMITNHAYLDNATFRGMRRSLMRTFDEIYILNLHGNSLKRERCPDGSQDENVFDIRQGVCIALFVKTGAEKSGEPVIRYADLWGPREAKYEWLRENDVESTPWSIVEPRPDAYLFVPQDTRYLDQYLRFWALPDIFRASSVGVTTARNNLTIQWTREGMWDVVQDFAKLDPEIARNKYRLGKDARDWKVELAQQDLRADLNQAKVLPIMYRPFDVRYTYYTGRSRGFHCMPRRGVMQHMLMEGMENIGIVVPRQVKSGAWNHCIVSNLITEFSVISNRTSENGYLFPLYVQSSDQGVVRKQAWPNIEKHVFSTLQAVYGEVVTPEQVLSYIYAVLHAPTYRERYSEYLIRDFPRVPFPNTRSAFLRMALLGGRLIDLHLLRSPELDPPTARFHGSGNNQVVGGKSGLRYDPQAERVYINKDQYFAPVSRGAWGYVVGAYQVAHKWLKDRKGRTLTLTDIQTYCRVITALDRTIEVQEEIDQVYQEIESDPMDR